LANAPLDPGGSTEDGLDLWRLAYQTRERSNQLYAPPWSLNVSYQAHLILSGAINRYFDAVLAKPEHGPGQPAGLPVDEASLRRDLILRGQDFQLIFEAEIQTMAAYYVPQQGIYRTDDLIDRAEFTLPEETRNKIDRIVANEIQQAGKCLAFGVPTASGFHMMRAVEAVLFHYCDTVAVTGQKKPGKSKNWGDYTAYLARSTEPDVIETRALLHPLGKNQRDHIMHPEKVLTPNEAYSLFQEGQAAINRMAERLPLPASSLADSAST
jgi:hypothetical protein